MTTKRVADVLVDTLLAAGAERIYGHAGDSLNGITDSIRARDNNRWIPVRHEETAHRQELSLPPTITLEQAAGFGTFMLKAVIDGRGDELVDLAKVNLFR
jgi:hypothetical protein